jgi:formylglycine-generating enzyme required for sulfatase activity
MKRDLRQRDAAKKGGVATRRWIWLVVFATVLAVALSLSLARNYRPSARTETALPASPLAATPAVATFAPTVQNKVPPPDQPSDGMAWIPGGEFSMGAQDEPDMNEIGMQATRDSRPIHRVYVDAFWMDKTDVTNEQFAKFVRATDYITVAERKPRAEDFPGAPPENLVAGAVTFSPPDHPVPLNDHYQWWSYIPGANWKHPEGPKSNLRGRRDAILISQSELVRVGAWPLRLWLGSRAAGCRGLEAPTASLFRAHRFLGC